MKEGALEAVRSEERAVAEGEIKNTLDRLKRLEGLVVQKTEDVECLKASVRIGREKN